MDATQAETSEEIKTDLDEAATAGAVEIPAEEDGSEGEGGDAPDTAPIVSFDEDSPPQDPSKERAPEWVANLRKENREKDRRIRELEAKQRALDPSTPGAPEIGPRPTLDDEDVSYDEEKFAEKMARWVEKKQQRDAWEARRKAEVENLGKEWKDRLGAYAKERETLKGDDFEESEFAVQKTLSEIQQSIIIKAVGNPARMVLALGKSPKKLAELAGIADPVRFAVEIGKLESKMGASASTKAPPPPERMISGTTATRATVDAKLEKLREEAARTGNFTKVNEYKRSLRK